MTARVRVTVRAVRPLVSGLVGLGHDPAPMLAHAQLDATTLEDPEASVPLRQVLALIDRAVQVTRDENLGLHLAQYAATGSFDVDLYGMLSSSTLGDGFRGLIRYQRLVRNGPTIQLASSDEVVTISCRMPGANRSLHHIGASLRHSVEFLLATWVRAGRMAVSSAWAPAEVCFEHDEPGRSEEHRRFFDAPVRFGAAEHALVLPVRLLELPCAQAEAALFRKLERYAGDPLERVPEAAAMVERVRAAVTVVLRNGEPSAAHVARYLQVTVRTLNAALVAEGTTFRVLRDEIRRALAVRHLADPRLSVSEVAFLLGFSAMSTFTRAFRQWTDDTPSRFRARVLRT